MTTTELTRIACSLTLRLRRDPAVAAKLEAAFGRPVRDCSKETLSQIGGTAALAAFWEREISTDPAISRLADSLLQLHSAPTRRPEPALPSKMRIARNAAGAIGRVVVHGIDKVDAAELAGRQAICLSCDLYRQSDDRCAECGCHLKYKTTLKTWHCPIGKW